MGHKGLCHVLQHSSRWPQVAFGYTEMKLKVQLPRALAEPSPTCGCGLQAGRAQMEPVLSVTESSMGWHCL